MDISESSGQTSDKKVKISRWHEHIAEIFGFMMEYENYQIFKDSHSKWRCEQNIPLAGDKSAKHIHGTLWDCTRCFIAVCYKVQGNGKLIFQKLHLVYRCLGRSYYDHHHRSMYSIKEY